MVDGQRIPLAGSVLDHAPRRGVPLELGIRPEFVRIGASPVNGALQAEIAMVEDLGNFKIVTARLGRHTLKAKLPEDDAGPRRPLLAELPAGPHQALRRRPAGGLREAH